MIMLTVTGRVSDDLYIVGVEMPLDGPSTHDKELAT